MNHKEPFVIASNNRAKTNELINCFAYEGITAISYLDLIDKQTFPNEGTNSYLENASGKARFVSKLLPANTIVADDSGMILDALPGNLGVQTARQLKDYSNEEHRLNQRILDLVGQKSRAVTMTTTLVLIDGTGLFHATGEFHGEIAMKESGSNGSSFDLILVPKGMHKTLAQLDDEQKIPLLHRTKAIVNLMRHPQE